MKGQRQEWRKRHSSNPPKSRFVLQDIPPPPPPKKKKVDWHFQKFVLPLFQFCLRLPMTLVSSGHQENLSGTPCMPLRGRVCVGGEEEEGRLGKKFSLCVCGCVSMKHYYYVRVCVCACPTPGGEGGRGRRGLLLLSKRKVQVWAGGRRRRRRRRRKGKRPRLHFRKTEY